MMHLSRERTIFFVCYQFFKQLRNRFGRKPPILTNGATYSTLHSGQRSSRIVPKSSQISKGPGVLLGSYTWGQDARILGSLSEEERKNIVIRMIWRFHPEIAENGMVDDYASIFWESYPWMVGGSFSFLLPGQQTTLYKYAIQAEGNIHCSLENW
jgi:monoamine oxidase